MNTNNTNMSSAAFSAVEPKAVDMSSAAFSAVEPKAVDAEEVKFTTGKSLLGTILIARSGVGVCAILIGDDNEALQSDLVDEFTHAKLSRDDNALRADLDAVLSFIETPAKGLDLPLDIRGTPFQRRVWDALLGVRVGYKITYAALARRIGEPNAARAVARACAANAIALSIPCHRVVGSHGALAGYRWGIERKRLLLEKEAEAVA